MDRGKLRLLLHTIKYLRYTQIYYQVYYLIRNRFFKRNYTKPLTKVVQPLLWKDSFLYQNSFAIHNEFTFLNIKYQFEKDIDWNYQEFGKLWTYNLNYFDFLNQENITVDEGLQLIKAYLKNETKLRDGKEPYPISLRGINWIKFLSKHKVSDAQIDQGLYNHYQVLLHTLEYHLLGNHLLENGYAVLFGAYYFQDETLYKVAKKILKAELTEQVLKDGAHFELSPMYHQILLYRLLDCIQLTQNNDWKGYELKTFLSNKAIQMLSWLQTITYRNGNIPMVNDSAYGIAPSSHQLFEYAKDLGLLWKEGKLSDSGYRIFRKEKYELFVDIGNIQPTYQPGHSHSDTFNFELYANDIPVIVDVGTSTYEKNELRLQERQTASHNTVQVGNYEQTEVWDGFRVAERARIISINTDIEGIAATHDGYKKIGILHTRKFFVEEDKITIEDIVSKKNEYTQVAHFHFHPNIDEVKITGRDVHLPNASIRMQFNNEVEKIILENYEYALGFNKRSKAKKIKVYFKTTLSTVIQL